MLLISGGVKPLTVKKRKLSHISEKTFDQSSNFLIKSFKTKIKAYKRLPKRKATKKLRIV